MWELLERYFSRYPAQSRVAKLMLNRGFRVDNGNVYAGEVNFGGGRGQSVLEIAARVARRGHCESWRDCVHRRDQYWHGGEGFRTWLDVPRFENELVNLPNHRFQAEASSDVVDGYHSEVNKPSQ